MQYWYKLIENWVLKENRTGLTIPYLIGAQHYLHTQHNYLTINDLFDEIINSDNRNIITLFWCDTTGENVLGMLLRPYVMPGKKFYNAQGNISLIVSDSLFISGNTIEYLKGYLSKKYADYIKNDKYSFNKSILKFDLFSEADALKIKAVLH